MSEMLSGLLRALLGGGDVLPPRERQIPLASLVMSNPIGTETVQGMSNADPSFQPGVEWGKMGMVSRPMYDMAQGAVGNALGWAGSAGAPRYSAAAQSAEAAPSVAYKQLSDVQKLWDDMNLSHHIGENGNYINVSKIVVPEAERGKGLGTQAMQALNEYADATGKTVVLSPSKDFGASSLSRLTDFYKSLGFVPNKGRARDFETRETMVRVPAKGSGQ